MSLTDDQITDIACKHCKFVPEGMYLYKQFEFKSSLVAFVRECIDAATLMANGPAERSEWPIKPLDKVQVRLPDGTHTMLQPVFPVFDAASMQELEDRAAASVAGLAGAAGVDQDAARWRWLMDNCGFEPRGRVVELRLVFEPTHVQYFYELVPAIVLALAKAASTRAGE